MVDLLQEQVAADFAGDLEKGMTKRAASGKTERRLAG